MKEKFIFIICLLIIFSTPVFADGFDEFADIDRAWDGQKSITNKEFEEAMDVLQTKQKKREAKQKKKKMKKISGGGNSLHPEMQPDKEIVEIELANTEDEGLLLNLPVCIYVDGKKFEKGYYNVKAERDKDKKIFMNFYQSHELIGKVQAKETEEDFGQETVNFVSWSQYNDSFIKIVFGCVDFNAFAYVPYTE